MLNQHQLMNPEVYKFRAGAINVAWIVGMLRNLDRRTGTGWIQQTNNLNQAIPFSMREGETIPTKFQEGQTVKVVGRFIGFVENGQQTAHIEALGFQEPTIMDMPTRQHFDAPIQPGTPDDGVRPEQYGQIPAGEANGFTARNPNANRVHYAGFVSAYRFDPSKNPGVTNDVLTIHLRQSPNPEDIVQVRIQNKLAKVFHSRLQVGVGIFIEGEARMYIKDLSKTPDETTGIKPTAKVLTLHARNISPAQPVVHIRNTPEWKNEMVAAHQRRREERRREMDERAKG